MTSGARSDCYCDLWKTSPKTLEDQGVPPGHCGVCGCGAPGHTRPYPGPVAVTLAWCDECYRELPRIPLMTRLLNLALLLFALLLLGGAWLVFR
jgi:hypothetical protein